MECSKDRLWEYNTLDIESLLYENPEVGQPLDGVHYEVQNFARLMDIDFYLLGMVRDWGVVGQGLDDFEAVEYNIEPIPSDVVQATACHVVWCSTKID